MKNVVYLIIAIAFFAVAYYVYWIVAQENAAAPEAATRSLGRPGSRSPSEFMTFIQQWQPYLTLASSLAGIASFLVQVRVWFRSRA